MLKRLNGNYGLSPLAGIHCFGPDGKRLQLLELEVVDENSEPGYVQQGLIVGTRKGSLRILRLREEGKKRWMRHHFSMAIRITTDLYSNNGWEIWNQLHGCSKVGLSFLCPNFNLE